MNDRISDSDAWDLEAHDDDRAHSREVLMDRLKSGAIRFEEYEMRLDLVSRARYVGDLYSATFGHHSFFLIGKRWQRRIVLIDVIGVVLAAILFAASFMMGWIRVVSYTLLGVLVLMNVSWVIQRLRIHGFRRHIRARQSIG